MNEEVKKIIDTHIEYEKQISKALGPPTEIGRSWTGNSMEIVNARYEQIIKDMTGWIGVGFPLWISFAIHGFLNTGRSR